MTDQCKAWVALGATEYGVKCTVGGPHVQHRAAVPGHPKPLMVERTVEVVVCWSDAEWQR